MGGKSYYCDYCCCFMKNDLNVRKKHNTGLSHTVAKATYMRRFEDPLKLLMDERAKVPCKRYFAGYCKFELFCQFGHYTEKQLAQLQKIVTQKKKLRHKHSKKRRQDNLWQSKRSTHALPPSLQPMDFARLRQTTMISWG